MDNRTLIRMANQIARAFDAEGEEQAIAATAAHIRDFWDPRMKSAILRNSLGLSPIAARAIASLDIKPG